MATLRRNNDSVLNWLRAAAIGGATFAGLIGMQFRPTAGAVGLAVVAAVLGLLSADLGVLIAVIALSLPMIAVQPVLGVFFVLLGIVGVRYLGSEGGRSFLVVALGVAGAFFGPGWAAAALAGWLLGAGEGALAAALACLTAEALGIALGREAIGSLVTGGSAALLDFAKMPDTMLSAAWVSDSFSRIDVDAVNGAVSTFAALNHPFALAAQPALWAGGAVAAALIGREARARASMPLHLGAVAVGVAIPAAGSFAIASALDAGIATSALFTALVSSLFVALVVAFMIERFFPVLKPVAAAARRDTSLAAEDADVDELLRLIATAEDTLASKHTTEKVVMITDMKSFSKMTEEDGSMLTAKAIQRHRDLLLPVIERHGGHGKSTGGDGLIAAFDSEGPALLAVAEIQQALAAHNVAHPGERPMTVRAGIARGEVVLDKGGRPFIGAALNLAARVMNLADGGQAFAAGDVVREAPGLVRTYSHGDFELKNIAGTTEVVEILWEDGQEPVDPRTRES